MSVSYCIIRWLNDKHVKFGTAEEGLAFHQLGSFALLEIFGFQQAGYDSLNCPLQILVCLQSCPNSPTDSHGKAVSVRKAGRNGIFVDV